MSETTPKSEEAKNATLSLTVDVVIFSLRPRDPLQIGQEPDEELQQELHVLLIRRAKDPFKGCWALPGGRVHPEEGLEQAAVRQLAEKTSLRASYLEQLYTFGRLERDPRGRTVSVVYYALVRSDKLEIAPGPGTTEARWFPVDPVPGALAFDHSEILNYALWRLRNKVKYANIAFQFLPPTFTLSQLRAVYEAITGRKEDPGNFKRKVEASGAIVKTEARVEGGRHRPPSLYRAELQTDLLHRGPVS
jgi:ADP-ribose pyrophosphatase YjhB (NUDIX family)